jgi:hypothetical protein
MNCAETCSKEAEYRLYTTTPAHFRQPIYPAKAENIEGNGPLQFLGRRRIMLSWFLCSRYKKHNIAPADVYTKLRPSLKLISKWASKEMSTMTYMATFFFCFFFFVLFFPFCIHFSPLIKLLSFFFFFFFFYLIHWIISVRVVCVSMRQSKCFL